MDMNEYLERIMAALEGIEVCLASIVAEKVSDGGFLRGDLENDPGAIAALNTLRSYGSNAAGFMKYLVERGEDGGSDGEAEE